jgi:glycerate dehydrogenase
MRVLFSSYKGVSGMGPLYTPFDDVLRQSDVITLHLPLMPSTRNLIAAAEFAQMERRPLLINTARGGLVDENALCEALESGQISGAGFDVVTVERRQPIIHSCGCWHCRISSSRRTSPGRVVKRQGLADQLIENIDLFWHGTPRNVVIP